MSETFSEGDVLTPAPASSIIGNFRRLHAKQIEDSTIDLLVPGMTDETGGLYARFRKPSSESLTAFEKRIESKEKDRIVVANADALARNAVGLLWKDADGVERSIDPDFEDGYVTPFGPRLAMLLDLPWSSSAVALIRAIYGARDEDGQVVHIDMNVITTAGKLMQWAQGDSDDLGN